MFLQLLTISIFLEEASRKKSVFVFLKNEYYIYFVFQTYNVELKMLQKYLSQEMFRLRLMMI